jgi:DNA repair exonuclease SbcCD ATPase subunit
MAVSSEVKAALPTLSSRSDGLEDRLQRLEDEAKRIRDIETRLSVLESRLAKVEPLPPQSPDIDKRLAVVQKALDLVEKAADPVRVGNLQADVAELKNVAAQNRLTWPMVVGWGVPVLPSLVSLFVSLLRTKS